MYNLQALLLVTAILNGDYNRYGGLSMSDFLRDTFYDTVDLTGKVLDHSDQLGQLSEVIVNVTKFAVTGAADHSQALKDAIASLPNGGEIRFPAGTFTVNNVSLPTNIRIKGAGKDATKIRRNADNPVLKVVGTPLPNGGNPSHWNNGLEDLTVTSSGTFTSDLTSFQGVTGMNINRVKFDAYNCRLMYANQMWDSRITNTQFFNGGKSDGTPALELASGFNSYRMTKETVIEGCHFEGYAGAAIRTLRDVASGHKTHMMTFANLKFESSVCTGSHLNLEINNSSFSNVYVTNWYTTTDVIKMTGCRGIWGDLAFNYVTQSGTSVPQSLINIDSNGFLINLNVLVEEPQPNGANVATIDAASQKVFLNITANQPIINNVNTSIGKIGSGRIWFDSNFRPRISSGVPTNIDTSGYEVVRRQYGNTAQRPSGLTSTDIGYDYFDISVNKNIRWNGNSWKDANNVNPENVGINAAVTASATSLAVTFPSAEPNANYSVAVSPTWNTTYWVTGKTAAGFTINFGTAPVGASTLDWGIKR